MFRGQVGDRVDGVEGDFPGFAVHAAALELDGLAGTGEERVADGADLDAPDLAAAVASVAGAVL